MKTALRLSGASILLADLSLIAGIVVTTVYNLGPEESLPLTAAQGLERLGKLQGLYTLRELFFLAYPVLLLPQGIALYSLLRQRSPALLWPLVFWSIGLTLGITVDLFTVGVARGLGAAYLAAPEDTRLALQSLAGSADYAIRLTQFVCDNLSGTLAVPFFAVSAYRQGFISKSLAGIGAIATILVCVGYRGLNLIDAGASPVSSALGMGWYGVLYWDVCIALMLIRMQAGAGQAAKGAAF